MCERCKNSKECNHYEVSYSEEELNMLQEKLEELDRRPLKIQKELLEKLQYLNHKPT